MKAKRPAKKGTAAARATGQEPGRADASSPDVLKIITNLEGAAKLFNQIKDAVGDEIYKNAKDFAIFSQHEGLIRIGSRIAAHHRATGELPAEDVKLYQDMWNLCVAQANPNGIQSAVIRNAKGELELCNYFYAWSSNWRWAVVWADRGNRLPLCELLASEEATEEGRILINDLLDRYQPLPISRPDHWSMEYQQQLAIKILAYGLRKKRARPTTPIYEASFRDAQIDNAISEVRALRQAFPGNKKLMEAVAELHGPKNEENPPDTPELSEDTLADAMAGRRGSANRKRQRWKRYKGG
jgi:hypothetical protein